jgi:flagellar FliL protein
MAVSALKKEPGKSAAAAETVAPSKKRTLKWQLPLIILCVIGGAGGGGVYWYMNRHHGDATKDVNAEPVKPPQFLPLDAFTVNLLLEENPQFLQVGLTLKVSDNIAIETLKLHMPEVRDRILLLLAGQKASVLLTLDGKRQLAADIVKSINAIIAPVPMPAKSAPKATRAENPVTADADTKPVVEADAGAKPAAEADTKPAVEDRNVPATAALPASPVLSVLFTSFIIQ